MIKEHFVFLQEFIREFESTGSLMSTSSWAASVLASPLDHSSGQGSENSKASGRKILEVGAGTGPITRSLLNKMRECDELHICEMNPRLMKTLRESLEKNSNWEKHKTNLYYYECPVQEIETDKKFDLIVCSLPFLNFSLDLTSEIFEKLRSLSCDSSTMTFFEYAGIRFLTKHIALPARRARIRKLDKFFKKLFLQSEIENRLVCSNAPPMSVHFLKF